MMLLTVIMAVMVGVMVLLTLMVMVTGCWC